MVLSNQRQLGFKLALIAVSAIALFSALGLNVWAAGDTQTFLVRFADTHQASTVLARHHLVRTNSDTVPGYTQVRAITNQPNAVLSGLRSDLGVIEVGYQIQASQVPNDPNYNLQWAPPKIGLPAAWDATTGSSSVIVAVIDTGFALSHEDLSGRFVAGYDFVHGDADPSVGQDCLGNPSTCVPYGTHGTLTAGIIAASANNGKGGAGANWVSKIMPIQALADSGSGSTTNVANGIIWAADHGANVISMSLGSSSNDPQLHSAVQYAYNRGVVLAGASGNSGVAGVLFPAAYSEVLGVGASDSNDNAASFSNSGPELDVIAPGVDTYTTYWTTSNQASAYAYGTGTSLATPYVAAAASLIKSRTPSLSASQIMDKIRADAIKVSGMGGANFTNKYGYGRLSLASASVYTSQYHSQSPYPSVKQNTTTPTFLMYKNTGNTTWYDDTVSGVPHVHLATSRPINRRSPFSDQSWCNPGHGNRTNCTFSAVYEENGTTLASNQHAAIPGQIVKFSFILAVPGWTPTGIYNEFFQPIVEGGSTMNDPGTFMQISVVPNVYTSQYHSQSPYPSVKQNTTTPTFLMYKNTGNTTWYDDTVSGVPHVHLATSRPINRRSPFSDQSWCNPVHGNRTNCTFSAVYEENGTTLASNQHAAIPGQIVKFSFILAVPGWTPTGIYNEFFQPIVEGGSTMNDPGTFMQISVHP